MCVSQTYLSQAGSPRDQYRPPHCPTSSYMIWMMGLKFADNTELGGEMNLLEGKAILQSNLDRLEEWPSKKFDKDVCKVLHLGCHNQRAHYRLGSVWLGIRLAEKDQEALMVNKLNMSPCAAAAAKANEIPSRLHPQGHY